MPTQKAASASLKPQYLIRNNTKMLIMEKYARPSKNWMKLVSQKFCPQSFSTPNSEK